MQIVIDIDEARYKDIQRIAEVQLESNRFQTAEQIIAKGIPTEQEPKTGHWVWIQSGHGKIIDVNDLLDRICLDDTDKNREDNVGEIITLEDIDFIPAIIEADEAESEDKIND